MELSVASPLLFRPVTRPATTTSANQPTTSHPSWTSISETWDARAADAGDLVGAGEAAAGEAAGRHAGEDGPKR